MTGMDMGRFDKRHDAVAANSGMEFADVPRLVVANGLVIRLVGDFQSVWEHFVTTEAGPRPYYCDGPEGDCPLCQAANRLCFSDDEAKQKIGKDIRAKERFYFNALDRTPVGQQWHEANKKAKVLTQTEKSLSIGSMLFKAIGDVVKMRRQQGQPEDPNTFDLMTTKSGAGMKTKYSAQFTGDVTELTDDEKAYELWPLDQMAKITARGERDTIAAFVLGQGPAPAAAAAETESAGDTSFNPEEYEAEGPAGAAAPAGAATATAPTQTAAPAASPPPATPPGQEPAAAAAPAKLTVKPKSEHQDTKPRDGVDESTHMTVPCSECSSDMLINMDDERDLKCHSCGKVYLHPNKG